MLFYLSVQKRDVCNQILNGILHECRVQLFDIAVFEACAVFFFFTSVSQKSRRESEVTDKPDVITEEAIGK